ncbi:MAG: glycine cleavage system regulatory protein [Gammaproteobacteria bacterium]|nr:MAG: glycine cleavage system regulatory protein [Gammaproteobacteria bacterium]TND02630.1 MAG: glycine cleavage system regulatory protein [Gammaproteobacteria bacterium]
MKQWFMLTVVGTDRPGIVARITTRLFDNGGNLGEASMARLGGNFTIMLMVQYDGDTAALQRLLAPLSAELGLHFHIDEIEGRLHEHIVPDVRISVYGADRAGIVAQVTSALAAAGFNILDLESDVAGTERKPVYVMHIEGCATRGIEALTQAVADFARDGLDIRLTSIDTLMG